MGRPPDNRDAVNLKSHLKVRVAGKRSTKGVLGSTFVNLICKKKNIDVNSLVSPEPLKNDEGLLAPTPMGIGI